MDSGLWMPDGNYLTKDADMIALQRANGELGKVDNFRTQIKSVNVSQYELHLGQSSYVSSADM